MRADPKFEQLRDVSYGVTGQTFEKGPHQKMCGREFWQLNSGKDLMYQTVFKFTGEISDTMH